MGKPYIFPDDFTIGKRVHWHYGSTVLTGYVTRVLDDNFKPARVRSNGRSYVPHINNYCNEAGKPPRRFDASAPFRSERDESRAKFDEEEQRKWDEMKHGKPLKRTLVRRSKGTKLYAVRDKKGKFKDITSYKRAHGRNIVRAAGINTVTGEDLSVSHGVKGGEGIIGAPRGVINVALMGENEYANIGRPWQYTVADYEVRQGRDGKWGIYTRAYNCRIATFAANSFGLRSALDRMFMAAYTLKQSNKLKFKRERSA